MKRFKEETALDSKRNDTELLAIIIYVIVGFLVIYYGFMFLINSII